MEDIGLLNLSEAEFYVGDGGFTGLKYGEKDYRHITLRRSLPINQPSHYISVADQDNKEIGLIRSVEELTGKQREIIENELENRYYSPEVLEVLSVKDKLGYVYMEMRIQNKNGKAYVKNCAVKDVNKNIRMLSDSSMIIFDVDGNRYLVHSLSKLDKNSMRRLDPYLF